MSLRRRMRHLIVIERPAELDTAANEYGDEDETTADYWTVDEAETRAYIEVAGNLESETDRETQAQRFNVYVAPDVALDGYCRVRFSWLEDEELLARVIGEPQRYALAGHGLSHTVALVEVVV